MEPAGRANARPMTGSAKSGTGAQAVKISRIAWSLSSGGASRRPVGSIRATDPRSRVLQRHPELGFGLGLHLGERDALGAFDQGHAVLAVLVDGEHGEIRHHHGDHPLSRQRQIALLQKSWAVLDGTLHPHHYAL